jgi:ribosomal-protein-alanine N-acetyltransferase
MSAAVLRDVELAGELVRLVPVHPRFAEPAFELLHGNETVLRWLLWDGPASVEELAQSFTAWARESADGDDDLLAILERATGEFVGSIGPRFRGHPGTADLGYWLAPARWGRGMMSEAVRLAAHLSFRHLAARTVTAAVFVGNAGSRRVLEKNGFLMVHTARRNARKGDRLVDEWLFTLTRHDFDAASAGWAPAFERVAFATGSTGCTPPTDRG